MVKRWSPAVYIEPLVNEFELKGLEPDTNYLIKVRLFNTAGVGEQTVAKKTSRSHIGKLVLELLHLMLFISSFLQTEIWLIDQVHLFIFV